MELPAQKVKFLNKETASIDVSFGQFDSEGWKIEDYFSCT